MTTFNNLTQEVRNYLRSFTGVQEEVVALSGAIDDSTLSINTSDNSRLRRGVVQIDDELIYVDGLSSGSISTTPFSRGFQDTTAASHSDGAMVVVDPVFPNKNIKDAILQTQAAVYPDLFRVKSTTFTATNAYGYEIPSDVGRILRVSNDSIIADGFKEMIRRYDLVPDTDIFPSGKSIEIFGYVPIGREIEVIYAADFTPFSSGSDTLAAAGHAESHRDVLILGACWRLIQFIEASRFNLNAVEQQARAQFSNSGSATSMARNVYTLYSQRLQEERRKLQRLYPTTVRKTR